MIVKAAFISVWDGGTQIISPCEVDTETKEIINIERVEVANNVNVLDGEYVQIDGELFGACSKEDADSVSPGYWYWYHSKEIKHVF